MSAHTPGWRVVPTDPTEEMLRAAYPLHWDESPGRNLTAHYKAMLSVIPAPTSTSGPWAVNPVLAQVDAMPSLLPVCQMLWPTTDRSEAETEANARLIAAAPDLLKAAQDALSDMAWAEKAVPGTNFQSAIILLTAAIAKATGAS